MIETLIDKLDSVEEIRDRVASILAVEVASQMQLAAAEDKDPDLWRLRVFVERTNPWEILQEADGDATAPPIANVFIDVANSELAGSEPVERQKWTATINIDCYSHAVSHDADDGHEPGDELAAKAVQRAVRLVRNILMAPHYIRLGYPPNTRCNPNRPIMWRRWVQSATYFQPETDGRPVERIRAARVALQVEYNEFTPQFEGAPLEFVHASVRRADTGEVYFEAGFASETSEEEDHDGS